MSSSKIKPQVILLDEFLAAVPIEYRVFVSKTNETMVKNGYKQKIERKASGLTATYLQPKTNKILIQFYFRKNVLYMYLYIVFFMNMMAF